MKWGHTYEIKKAERLLYLVLSWIVAQSSPLDNWLKVILTVNGGMGADPGWEMEHIPSDDKSGAYRVWADPEMSGIETHEAIYSADVVHRALRESLLAFGEVFPERMNEVQEVLARHSSLRENGGGSC